MIINKFLNIIKKDAKIFVFYFEGNDFKKINRQINKKKIIKTLTELLYFENIAVVKKTLDYFINLLGKEKKNFV